jgi:uroporphyrinogen-III synthase
MARVLITRPEPQASGTAEQLRRLGHVPLVSPLLAYAPTRFQVPDTAWDALVFTSAQAPRMAAHLAALKPLPVFAIGTPTAQAAREAGFTHAQDAGHGHRDQLVRALAAAKVRCGLYLSGLDERSDLVAEAAAAGASLTRIAVYAALPEPAFSAAAMAALAAREVDAALLYSPRTARLFRLLMNAAGLPWPPHVLCLSAAIATSFAAPEGVSVEVADTPDTAALLRLL